MSMVIRSNLALAWANIRRNRVRSGFTMVGIVLAVVPVLIIAGIGQGIKDEINTQVTDFGSDLITIRPGNFDDAKNPLAQFNTLSGFSSSANLTSGDLAAVQKSPVVDMAAPLALIPGVVSVNGTSYPATPVLATTSELPILTNHSVQYGDFFEPNDYGRNVAVIGRNVASALFDENVPLGRSFVFHGQTYIVRGVLERFDVAPLSLALDYNDAVLVPYQASTGLTSEVPIFQILARPKAAVGLNNATQELRTVMRDSRGGANDVSVLTQEDTARIADRILSLLTVLVSSVAGIALLVAGISIMNIMLVSVAERMHEIGVRKAIGATKSQIVDQFMAEAFLISIVGSIIGVAVAFIAQYFIGLFTDVQPFITWKAALLVSAVSIFVGIFFGSIPALKAARKDPIAALRNE